MGNGARPALETNLSEDSMFRITAGIDFEHYQKALSIVQRLKPANGAIDLIHVVESLLPDESFPNLASTHPVAMIMAERNRQGHAELDKAESLLEGSGLQINKLMTQGDPPREILDQANSSGADLIAVGSGQKRHLEFALLRKRNQGASSASHPVHTRGQEFGDPLKWSSPCFCRG